MQSLTAINDLLRSLIDSFVTKDAFNTGNIFVIIFAPHLFDQRNKIISYNFIYIIIQYIIFSIFFYKIIYKNV